MNNLVGQNYIFYFNKTSVELGYYLAAAQKKTPKRF